MCMDVCMDGDPLKARSQWMLVPCADDPASYNIVSVMCGKMLCVEAGQKPGSSSALKLGSDATSDDAKFCVMRTKDEHGSMFTVCAQSTKGVPTYLTAPADKQTVTRVQMCSDMSCTRAQWRIAIALTPGFIRHSKLHVHDMQLTLDSAPWPDSLSPLKNTHFDHLLAWLCCWREGRHHEWSTAFRVDTHKVINVKTDIPPHRCIVRAWHGSPAQPWSRSGKDVTALIRSTYEDPDNAGDRKHARLSSRFSIGKQTIVLVNTLAVDLHRVPEGGTLMLPPNRSVLCAWFGGADMPPWSSEGGVDVTTQVRDLYTRRGIFKVEERHFGTTSDGMHKILLVETLGVEVYRALESNYLLLPPHRSITRAWYGHPKHVWSKRGFDVTMSVRATYAKSSTIFVSSKKFGNPVPQVRKVLVVETSPLMPKEIAASAMCKGMGVRVVRQMESAAKPLLLAVAGTLTPFLFKRGDNLRLDWAVSIHAIDSIYPVVKT